MFGLDASTESVETESKISQNLQCVCHIQHAPDIRETNISEKVYRELVIPKAYNNDVFNLLYLEEKGRLLCRGPQCRNVFKFYYPGEFAAIFETVFGGESGT
jgi:hypothetical protein